MIRKRLQEINARLKAWRDVRGITMESQRQGLVINLLEEFVELNRAKSEYEKIDALCDMCVFILNAYEIDPMVYFIASDYVFKEKFLSAIHAMEASKKEYTHKMNVLRLLELIDRELFKLEYDTYLCLCETLKEIESRQGKYDNVAKKWIKDSNVETYKANYSKCKKDSK